MHAQIMVRMAGGRAAPTHTHNFPSLPTSVESDSLGFRFKYLFLKYKTMSQPSGLRSEHLQMKRADGIPTSQSPESS